MRRTALLLVLLCTFPALVAAQQSGDRATAEHKDVGRLSVRTQIYSQAVGVVSELVRSSFAQTVECNAVEQDLALGRAVLGELLDHRSSRFFFSNAVQSIRFPTRVKPSSRLGGTRGGCRDRRGAVARAGVSSCSASASHRHG